MAKAAVFAVLVMHRFDPLDRDRHSILVEVLVRQTLLIEEAALTQASLCAFRRAVVVAAPVLGHVTTLERVLTHAQAVVSAVDGALVRLWTFGLNTAVVCHITLGAMAHTIVAFAVFRAVARARLQVAQPAVISSRANTLAAYLLPVDTRDNAALWPRETIVTRALAVHFRAVPRAHCRRAVCTTVGFLAHAHTVRALTIAAAGIGTTGGGACQTSVSLGTVASAIISATFAMAAAGWAVHALLAALSSEVSITCTRHVRPTSFANSIPVACIRAVLNLAPRAAIAFQALTSLPPWVRLDAATVLTATVIGAVSLAAVLAMESGFTLAHRGTIH